MSFDILGLSPGADEREVRRAYARLLKLNRPDDDPLAFQELNEAYRDCLAQLRDQRWEDSYEDESPDDGGYPESRSTSADYDDGAAPEFDPQEASFRMGAFTNELLQRVAKETPDQVSAWLTTLPELYSIRLKSAIAVEVVSTLVDHDPPLPSGSVDSVAEFFGIEQLGPRGWWLLERLQEQRRRADLVRRFATGNLPRANTLEEERALNRAIDNELSRPDWSWRTPLLALWPGVPSAARDRMAELDNLTEGLASQMILPRRRQFFLKLADRSRLSLARYTLSILRTLMFGGALVLLAHLLVGHFPEELIRGLAVAGVGFLAWQTGLAGFLKLRQSVENRGYGHLVREGLIAIGVVLALSLGVFKQESLHLLTFGLAAMACLQAYTGARLRYGYIITGLFMAFDAAMSLPRLDVWPFPPILLGICCSAVLVAVFDRVCARRLDVPVELVAQNDEGLAWLAAVTFIVLLIATVTLSVVFVGWR